MISRNLSLLFAFLLFFNSALLAQKQQYTSNSKKAIKYFEDATALYNQRRDEEAVMLFKKAIDTDKKFIEPYIVLTEVFSEQKRYTEALDYAQKAYEIDPSFFPRLLFNIADLEYKTAKYGEARKHLEEFASKPRLTEKDKKKVANLLASAKFAEEAVKNPVPFNPQNLGDGINTKYSEFGPAVTVDDKMLIYTMKAPFNGAPEDRPNTHSEDFFTSRNVNGKWEKAVNLGPPINTEGNEGSHCISPDGKLMFLTVCEEVGGYPAGRKGMGSCDIFYSENIGGQWTPPLNMGAAINSRAWDSQPAIAPDGRTLYFVSSRSGGKGAVDIWKSTLVNGAWTQAVNLGDSINTEGVEYSPFIHADNVTFYFSSDGHPSLGNNDLFLSKIKEDGTFSTPRNLGYPINTEREERSLIVNGRGDKAYYSSEMKGGYGALDLYSFDLPSSVRPIPVTYFKGRITDKSTGKPLVARFQLIDIQTGKVNADANSDKVDGTFLIPLPSGKSYALNVSAKGYLFYSENFDLPKAADVKPFEKDVALSPIVEGSTTVLRNIFFETASYGLKKESEVELDKLVEFLKTNPTVKGEIAGHTDNVGDRKMNQVLSENRSRSVIKYLTEHGIEANRLSAKGYADTQPLVPNTSDENRAQNRRTEFRITAK